MKPGLKKVLAIAQDGQGFKTCEVIGRWKVSWKARIIRIYVSDKSSVLVMSCEVYYYEGFDPVCLSVVCAVSIRVKCARGGGLKPEC